MLPTVEQLTSAGCHGKIITYAMLISIHGSFYEIIDHVQIPVMKNININKSCDRNPFLGQPIRRRTALTYKTFRYINSAECNL